MMSLEAENTKQPFPSDPIFTGCSVPHPYCRSTRCLDAGEPSWLETYLPEANET